MMHAVSRSAAVSPSAKQLQTCESSWRQWLIGWLIFSVAIFPGRVALATESLVFESREQPALLIELFTSEGCSSCPPADAWLSRLKSSPALWNTYVPVAFHVDYWNRLGWLDRFSSAEFTARQQRYAALGSGDSVYTPEVVINGREWRGFFTGQSLPAAAAEKVGRLKVTIVGRGRAEVSFTPTGHAPAPGRAQLALLGMNLESDVKRGENGGRRLRHDFVVLQVLTVDLSAEDKRYVATVSWTSRPGAEASAMAAWVVGRDGATPLQAVGGWLGPARD